MKLLKFLFTGRISFIVFALFAFVATMLYIGWVNRHQAPVVMHQRGTSETR